MNLPASRKYGNVAAGNQRVSLIVDDLVSADPWRARGIKVHGEATTGERDGRPALFIRPTVIWSGEADGSSFVNGHWQPRKTVWATQPD